MPTNDVPQEVADALRTLDDLAARPDVDLVALDAQAVRTSIDLATRATPADLTRPTPCAGWTLNDLLAHMTTQHYGFAAASTGDADPAQWQPRPVGDDPVAAYRASAERVIEAFSVDGLLGREFPLPEFSTDNTFPAAHAISFHFIDYVVHAWDVARTLDLPVHFEPPLLDAARVVAGIVPGGEARLAPGAAFGPEVPWSGGSALDEIVAMLGRSPAWPQ
ncbi:TIGR03086 family metal-binding protein [Phytoactinopolyspora endophytica]|uniref:TIGR03086 family metal-binding protein n=1 Tax=Phytoactinopolyspora endophytica TaxID=1642495 RepID=UPI00101C4BF3|nr:TIGR03086 family metal-binding protein [Phytoactinopolyspora endophytica]